MAAKERNLSSIQQERHLLDGRIPHWKERLNRVGVEGNIRFGTSLENTKRAGEARKGISARIHRSEERFQEVTGILESVDQARVYLADLERKRQLLSDIRKLAEEGFVPLNILQGHEQEFLDFEARPVSDPVLQRAIDLIRENEREKEIKEQEEANRGMEGQDAEEKSDKSDIEKRKQIGRGQRAITIGRLVFGIDAEMPDTFDELVAQAYPEDHIMEIADPEKRRVRINYHRVAIPGAVKALERILEDTRNQPKVLVDFVEELKQNKLFMGLTTEQREILATRSEGWKDIVKQLESSEEDGKGNENAGIHSTDHEQPLMQDLTGLQVRIMIKALEHDTVGFIYPTLDDITMEVWERLFAGFMTENHRNNVIQDRKGELLQIIPEAIKIYEEAIERRKQGETLPERLAIRYDNISRDTLLNHLSLEELEKVMKRELSFDEVKRIAETRNTKANNTAHPSDNGSIEAHQSTGTQQSPSLSVNSPVSVQITQEGAGIPSVTHPPMQEEKVSKEQQVYLVEKRDKEIRSRLNVFFDEIDKHSEIGDEQAGATITKAFHQLKQDKLLEMKRKGQLPIKREEGDKYFLDKVGIAVALYLKKYGKKLTPQLQRQVKDVAYEVYELRKNTASSPDKNKKQSRNENTDAANKFLDALLEGEE